MKHIILFVLCHLTSISSGQNSSTFFVTNRSKPNAVKLVLSVGDKMKVRYTNSSGTEKIKGKLKDIGETYIIIDSVRIQLAEIDLVSKHDKRIKIVGGILFSGGTGLIVAGNKRSENPIEIEKQTTGLLGGSTKTIIRDGSTMIGIGSILCGISSVGILIPRTFTKSRFRFATSIE